MINKEKSKCCGQLICTPLCPKFPAPKSEECENCKDHPDGDYGQCGECHRMIARFAEPKSEEVKAMCKDCELKFTTWLSDSTECPECEGQMLFFDCLHPLSPKEESKEKEGLGDIADNIRGIITKNSLSISGKVNGKYYHEVEFVLLWETLLEYFKQELAQSHQDLKDELVREINEIETNWDANNKEHDFTREGFYLGLAKVINIIKQK